MDELASSQNAPIYVGKMQRSKMQDALTISKDRLVVFDGPIISSEFEIDSINIEKGRARSLNVVIKKQKKIF